MKFIPCKAEGIKPFVANSPLMSWDCGVMSVSTPSIVLGVIEIAIGLLIALRPLWPKVSAIGSLLAAGMFLTTLTIVFSTPGNEQSLGGFPRIAAVPALLVLKDVVLLGAALSSAGEALLANELNYNDRNRTFADGRRVSDLSSVFQSHTRQFRRRE